MRSFRVDCSAGEDEYHEQYAAYHLAKGQLRMGVTSNVTLTRQRDDKVLSRAYRTAGGRALVGDRPYEAGVQDHKQATPVAA